MQWCLVLYTMTGLAIQVPTCVPMKNTLWEGVREREKGMRQKEKKLYNYTKTCPALLIWLKPFKLVGCLPKPFFQHVHHLSMSVLQYHFHSYIVSQSATASAQHLVAQSQTICWSVPPVAQFCFNFKFASELDTECCSPSVPALLSALSDQWENPRLKPVNNFSARRMRRIHKPTRLDSINSNRQFSYLPHTCIACHTSLSLTLSLFLSLVLFKEWMATLSFIFVCGFWSLQALHGTTLLSLMMRSTMRQSQAIVARNC